MNEATRVAWRVEGMDCASCVAKVTKAVERLPGVSDVEVNLMAERLSLSLSPGVGTPEEVVKQVEALGYTTRALATPAPAAPSGHVHGPDCGHDHSEPGHDHAAQAGAGHGPADGGHGNATGEAVSFGHSHADHDNPADAEKPWYATSKAKLVWVLGGLVLGAYALSLALPERFAYPLFLAATLVALVPFGRRAIALARAGSPFSIETLMVTAAIGAAVIGAAEEAAIVVLLFALGELLENVAAGRARAGIRALASLMPKVALRLRADGTHRAGPRRNVSRSATSCWSAPATACPATASSLKATPRSTKAR
jgi:Zn2+/Cd2+-exporting ATPase